MGARLFSRDSKSNMIDARTDKSADQLSRFAAFDYLRLFAMVLVTVQHGMTAAGFYERTSWGNISIGQTGVSLFCALSGYLAFLSKPSLPALAWLQKRLLQIYPAYWIATIAAFVLTWIAATKPIDGWLFLSQMLGTGYFTHGWDLVNVVSWFISLILLCYVIAFVGKWLGRPRFILAAAASIAFALLATQSEVAISRHVLTFCIAGLVAQVLPRTVAMLVLTAGLFAAAWFWSPAFYAGFGLALLAVALAWQTPATWLTRMTSPYVYEYFLVHGIFLSALAHFLPRPKLLSALLAIAFAMFAAVMLKKLAAWLVACVRSSVSIPTI